MISVVGKKEVIFYFDTEQGRKNFLIWYSNQGEQSSQYYEEESGKDWLYVKPPEECCTECEFYDIDRIQSILEQNKEKRKVELTCSNCEHKYKVKNYYFEKEKV